MHALQMPSSAWGTWFVIAIIHLAALSNPLHRANCHNIFSANNDSWQIADLTHTQKYLWVVFTIMIFAIELDMHFLAFIKSFT